MRRPPKWKISWRRGKHCTSPVTLGGGKKKKNTLKSYETNFENFLKTKFSFFILKICQQKLDFQDNKNEWFTLPENLGTS